MSGLAHDGETIKLGRVLGVAPERLAFLASVDVDTLRVLRERLAGTLLEDARPLLQRAVKGARLLTVGMVASIGERVFGALLCAHMAGIMEPARAVEVSLRMSLPFLADVSAMLEPKRAAAVIAAMPTGTIVAVAKILAERNDHVTLARFVGYLGDATVLAVIAAIPGDEPLMRTAAFLETREISTRMLALVPVERLRSVVRYLEEARVDVAALGLEALRAELDAVLSARAP